MLNSTRRKTSPLTDTLYWSQTAHACYVTREQRHPKLHGSIAPSQDSRRYLAALLSLPAGGRYRPLDLTPRKQKERTLRALVARVEGLAARQPVLMLFEDAQWSDPTSLELYDLIIDRVPAVRVLLIVTFRPEFTAPWTGRPHVSWLALNRLAPRQRAEMIAGVTGGKALPPEIAAQIIDRTDGVPLFVEELTKAVVESRHTHRRRRPLRGNRTDAGVGDPGELAGLAAGSPRPAGAGTRCRADRRRLGPAVHA